MYINKMLLISFMLEKWAAVQKGYIWAQDYWNKICKQLENHT